MEVSLAEAQKSKIAAKAIYNSNKPYAHKLREICLSKQEKYSETEQERKEAKRKRHIEKIRQQWVIINRIYGKTKSSSVMEIEVKTKGSYSRDSSISEVEDGIMSETEERFHLTDNTPLLSEETINHFGLLCEGLETNRVLKGSFTGD